ncbi:MAG: C10 family peptidase [Kiritimatiellia bacterium]
MNLSRLKVATLLVLSLLAKGAMGLPVPPELAVAAAEGYVHVGTAPCAGARLAGVAERVTTWESGGRPLFHIVTYSAGGFAAIAGDDSLAPVVAFSPGGVEPDEGSPLFDLLAGDLASRLRDAEAGTLDADAEEAAVDQWSRLTLASAATKVTLPADVRVEPLLSTKWNQSGGVYNYFTPSNYVCGCLATALAQVMKFWQAPRAEVAPFSRACQVAGKNVTLTAIGGVYDWESMPDGPNTSANTTLTQREAIGKLCYDAGVALGMKYTASLSSASGDQPPRALTEFFGYASAKAVVNPLVNATPSPLLEALYSNLDAKHPVILGIYSSSVGGHAVVADGYGHSDGVRYTHLNMGWSGQDDVWYALPEVQATKYRFNELVAVSFAIDPDEANREFVTGRITDSGGNPIAGAKVLATGGTGTYETVSDLHGIYSLSLPSPDPKGVYALTASSEGFADGVRSNVLIRASRNYSEGATDGVVGSLSGLDFVLGSEPSCIVTPLPANDDLSDAIPIEGLSGTCSADNTFATSETGEPAPSAASGYPNLGRSIWYSYTSPVDQPLTLYAWSEQAEFTSIELFTGTHLADLSLVASARFSAFDDGCTYLRTTAAAGQQYFIRIDTIAVPGMVHLGWTVNDLCFYSNTAYPDGLWLGGGQRNQSVFAYGSPVAVNFLFSDAWGNAVLDTFYLTLELTGDATSKLSFFCRPLGVDLYIGRLDYQWPAMQNLPPGNYSLTANLNATLAITESDYSNNSITRGFTIRAPQVEGTPIAGLSDQFVAETPQSEIDRLVQEYLEATPSSTAASVKNLLLGAESFGLTLADFSLKGLATFAPEVAIESFPLDGTPLTFRVRNGVTSEAEAATRFCASAYRTLTLQSGVEIGSLDDESQPSLTPNEDGSVSATFTPTTSGESRFWRLKVSRP